MPAGPVFRYGTGGFVKDMGDGMETFKVSNKVREKSMMALSVNCDTMDDYSKMHPRMHCYG